MGLRFRCEEPRKGRNVRPVARGRHGGACCLRVNTSQGRDSCPQIDDVYNDDWYGAQYYDHPHRHIDFDFNRHHSLCRDGVSP